MKIRPVGAELFHTDGRTDMTKLMVVFRNFANVPKKVKFTLCLKAIPVTCKVIWRQVRD
jgi:hypothetical protein